MPHLRIGTNLPRSKIPEGLEHELAQVLSTSLGRTLKSCNVTISPDKIMSVGGGNTPAIQATLMSIRNFGVAANKRHTKAITEKIQARLGIPPEYIVIHFQDAQDYEIGWNGTTVDVSGSP